MIIGVTGRARHGKDSVAAVLRDRFGFVRLALADPLKEACRIIFGWTREDTDGPLKETIDARWGISPRRAMQLLGTEFGQFCLCGVPEFQTITGRKLWVRRLLGSTEIPHEDVVVPDVRFPHEVDELRLHGARILRVVRPGIGGCAAHASENDQDRIVPDWTIQNDGTLEDLERAVCAVVEQARVA